MTRTKFNILANILGTGWDKLITLVCIPFYLKFLGVEAFGLIGFYAAFFSVLGLLDMGFGKTLNREMARLSGQPDKADDQCNLLRTLEIIYWFLAIVGGIIVFALSPIIATKWLNSHKISVATLQSAINIMSLSMVLQFPLGLYQGGLMGLKRQVTMNSILGVTGALRSFGAVLILWLVSPTITSFFLWQFFANFVRTITTAIFLWKAMPISIKCAQFKANLLMKILPFSAPLFGNSILGIALSQADKIILSKILNLELFGYYTLAFSIASILWSIVYPINYAAFPQFVQLFEIKDYSRLNNFYHLISQFISILLFPIACILIFFSPEIIRIWTNNPSIADKTHLLVSLLTIAIMLNSLATNPINLQIAAGWPQLILYTNIVLSIFLIPGIILMTVHYGAIGASVIWIIFNGAYLFINVPIMHYRILPNEKIRWYLEDIFYPFISTVLIFIAGRLYFPVQFSTVKVVFIIILLWFITTFLSIIVTTKIRTIMMDYLFNIKITRLS